MSRRQREEEREILAIDLDNLEEEWQDQPLLCKQYSDEHAEAKRELASENATLDVTWSEIAQEIRADPEKFGVDKVTEPMVKELIPLQKRYKKQRMVVIEAQHTLDVLAGTLKAIEHRKKALENEVYLFGQSYFSSPRAKGEAGEKLEKKTSRRGVKRMTREELDREDD